MVWFGMARLWTQLVWTETKNLKCLSYWVSKFLTNSKKSDFQLWYSGQFELSSNSAQDPRITTKPYKTIPYQTKTFLAYFKVFMTHFLGRKSVFPHVLRFWQYFLVLVGPKGSEFIDRLLKPFFKTWSWLRAGVGNIFNFVELDRKVIGLVLSIYSV